MVTEICKLNLLFMIWYFVRSLHFARSWRGARTFVSKSDEMGFEQTKLFAPPVLDSAVAKA